MKSDLVIGTKTYMVNMLASGDSSCLKCLNFILLITFEFQIVLWKSNFLDLLSSLEIKYFLACFLF